MGVCETEGDAEVGGFVEEDVEELGEGCGWG